MVARFWVGGTGTWDTTDTTHWASATNGAGGQTVPTSVDDVTFDANSTGTITVNGNHTVLSFTAAAFAGTLDWSVNNNDFTVLSGTTQFSGSSTRTIKLGTGTFYFDQISLFTVTGLTWTPSTSRIKIGQRGTPAITLTVALANTLTHPDVTIGPDTTYPIHSFSQTPTFTNLDLACPVKLRAGASLPITVTNLTSSGYSKGQGPEIRGEGVTITFALTNPAALHWAVLRGVATSGAALRAYNSLDGGNNSGVQISPPKRGRIIGG